MPLFEFRLEAQDESGNFRRGTTEAESEEAARAHLLAQEDEYAGFTLDEGGLAEHDKLVDTLAKFHKIKLDAGDDAGPVEKFHALKEAGHAGILPPQVRAHLAFHHQPAPYKLVKLEEVG
jgi:hypothetical protein